MKSIAALAEFEKREMHKVSVSKKSERYVVIANQWCSAQRIKILMTAGGSHTLM